MLKKIKADFKQINRYFRDSKDSIAKLNISMLKSVCCIGLVIVIFLMGISPFLFQGWKPDVAHYLLLALFTIFLFVAFYLEKKDYRYSQVHTIIICYIFLLIIDIILLNIVETPSSRAVFVSFSLIVFPVIFVLQFYEYLILLLGSISLTFYLMNYYTYPELIYNNLFNLITATLLSLMISFIILKLRAIDSLYTNDLIKTINEDFLTGINNKQAVENKCNDYLIHRANEYCALVFLDINNFKEINQNEGHVIGDEILGLVGNTISNTFKSSDIVGRIGGDEFLVLMKNTRDKEIIASKLKECNNYAHNKIISEYNIDISLSFGVIIDKDHSNFITLFNMADTLLSKSKKEINNSMIILDYDEFVNLNNDKYKILLAVNNEENRQLFIDNFKNKYIIEEVSDGQETLNLIYNSGKKFDIFIIDMNLNNIDGYEIIKIIKTNPQYRNVPLVVISDDLSLELEMLEFGVADIIKSPFNIKITKQKIDNILELNKIQ